MQAASALRKAATSHSVVLPLVLHAVLLALGLAAALPVFLVGFFAAEAPPRTLRRVGFSEGAEAEGLDVAALDLPLLLFRELLPLVVAFCRALLGAEGGFSALALHMSKSCFCKRDCCCICSFCSSSMDNTSFCSPFWSLGSSAGMSTAFCGSSALPARQAIMPWAVCLTACLSFWQDFIKSPAVPSTAFHAAEATPEQTPSHAELTTPAQS